ncbi:sigma-70 family RNA polymerase sigma factor [Chitinophaga polysaccharea]|uniref:sigma-70 family RNA polymerase sigma factor n=1 Tax=Chitinophaga TaxID=79328 RepID=UPI001455D954|nr:MULTISPECIES: sigma-70 family RNA polymerase sigma factor [Chitinophaga]NLR57315.1 sigma-70 family RNA polymerase sigma factor [Chitinophaga polysaccharea]NLU91567.1 sigma-70 family RNA polymerase sigma factor [Chitinophaga sp. Ak27]
MTTCNPTVWVKLYADELFKFACSRVSDTGLAQDLVQDTFLSGLQAMHQFRGESSEKTWLLAILKNKINDHFRMAGKAAITTLDMEARDQQLIFFNEKGHWRKEMAPRPWTTDINDKAEQADFFRILRTCMDKLTSLGKAVIQHKYLDEKKSADICKDLSLTSSNYWVIIHRARLQLRACLEKNWFSN